jgi:hypothetical protein
LNFRFRQFLGGIRRSLPDRSAPLRGAVINEFLNCRWLKNDSTIV